MAGKGTLRSPNEFMAAAKEHMLDGREPSTQEDWARIMNFLAYNIDSEVALIACKLFIVMYDMPLSEEYVEEIVLHQLAIREAE